MQLHELLEAVTDEATFLAFAHALAADRRGDAEHWENYSIEGFLEAASAWAEIQNSAPSKVCRQHHLGEGPQPSCTAYSHGSGHRFLRQ
jgi:hypothetical protein